MQIIRKAKAQGDKSCHLVQPEGEAAEGKGLAVDIGTTTVAMTLYDLTTGQNLGSMQEKNRQTTLGADVMMRLMHCQRGQAPKLRRLIQEQTEDMAEKLLLAGGYALHDLKKMAVVGNTTMCHIFLGQDTSGLAGSPFRPAYQGEYLCMGKEIGLKRLEEAQIYVPPGIDAHVGADAVSAAAFLEGEDFGVRLVVDIGTNAEMVLWNGEDIMAASVPAGPAFEGAQIYQGMRGEPGAISSFKIAASAQNILLEVIGKETAGEEVAGEQAATIPRGICGSGLIDSIAQLRQAGLVTAEGYLLEKKEANEKGCPEFLTERLTEEGFVLYFSETGDNVILTREDIRQFQLAKGAVQAGIRLLLESQNLSLADLEQVYVAGVFGGHISPKNAIATGLFPGISNKLQFVGNAAGQGAAQALLSEEFRAKSRKLAQKATHLELADREEFQREFLSSMTLKPWGESL